MKKQNAKKTAKKSTVFATLPKPSVFATLSQRFDKLSKSHHSYKKCRAWALNDVAELLGAQVGSTSPVAEKADVFEDAFERSVVRVSDAVLQQLANIKLAP
jgi:hypothetical protein